MRVYLLLKNKLLRFLVKVIFLYVPTSTRLGYLAIPNLVSEADVVISVTVLKTHHISSPVSPEINISRGSTFNNPAFEECVFF